MRKPQPSQEGAEGDLTTDDKIDRLADSWTEDETVLAQLNKGRSKDDIPPHEYGLYQTCLEETLQGPDEVWSHDSAGDDPKQLYHFIKHYAEEKPGMWFVIVARETDEEEQIEIIVSPRDSKPSNITARANRKSARLNPKPPLASFTDGIARESRLGTNTACSSPGSAPWPVYPGPQR